MRRQRTTIWIASPPICEQNGRAPYVIHLGSEHPPVGALGYVRAGAEMAEQCDAASESIDAVVTPSGSALTHIGMLFGLRAIGQTMPVHGVCVRRDRALQRERVMRRIRALGGLLELPWGETGGVGHDDDIILTDASLAPGYGKFGQLVYEAIRDAAHLEGLILDPVYSGKALAGLRRLVEAGDIARGSTVVYWLTGGQPAVFAYQAELQAFMNAESADAVAEAHA